MKIWRYGQPIEVLGERYFLEGMLGSGGMAEVCLAWDNYESRQVAIKILKADVFDQQMLNRFVKEAGQVVGWQHPHILPIYDHMQVEVIDNTAQGQQFFIFYIVMEYASNGDLQKRMTSGEPYYSLSTAFTIFRQMCGAVQYAHKHGVIHRDIKPLNILFRKPRTGPEEAVLSDFGLAVQVDASHHTFAEGGTFAYMAPEQFRGQAQPASDIFALGVTLYQLCTGYLPFRRDMQYLGPVLAGNEPDPIPPSQLNPHLPSELDELILRALEKNPADRYKSAAAFWNELATMLSAIKLPSETGRPVVNPSILSQPLSLLTAKVEAVGDEEEISQSPQGTRIVYQSTTQVQEEPKALKFTPSPVRRYRSSLGQPRLIKSRRFPPYLKIAGVATGVLLLLAALVFATPLLFASTTTITLIPRSHVEQNMYTLDANQAHAHQLIATAPAQTNTGNVSGTIPAQRAMGQLTFINQTNVDVTIPTTTIMGKSGIPITFQGPVVVPAINPPTAIVTGVAVNTGASGNIPLFDIDKFCCAPNNEIVVKNTTAFTGGQDAQPNNKVQQSDIDQAAKPLINTQTAQEQAQLKTQVKSNDQIINGSNTRQPTVTPNNPVGTQIKTVTVTVTVTCQEEVYDSSAIQTAAANLLSEQARQDLGANYQLNGRVTIHVLNTTANNSINVQAQGLWVYSFTDARLSQLASLVAGKTPTQARALLLQQEGVADVQIPTMGTLPGRDHIQIKIQAP